MNKTEREKFNLRSIKTMKEVDHLSLFIFTKKRKPFRDVDFLRVSHLTDLSKKQ